MGKTKFNDIRIRFLAGKNDSIEFQCFYKDAPKLKQPDAVEKEVSGLKLWKTKRDKDKIEFAFSYELTDGDLDKNLDSIHSTVDAYLAEGKLIVKSIERNGGKKGLFG